MTEPRDYSPEWTDVEALVRAAGSYIRPSDGLRPRVLEMASIEFREQRAHRRIRRVAIVVFIVGAISMAAAGRWHAANPHSASMLEVHPGTMQAEGGTPGWNTVESFTDLRQRQAALLSLTR